MKIAQIVCVYPPYKGGIGNSAFNFASLLRKGGFEVDTFTPDYSKNKYIENNSVKRLTPFLKFGHGAILPQLFWRLSRYEIIFFHYPFFGATEVLWLYLLLHKKQKLVLHYHMDVRHSNILGLLLSLPARLIKKSLFKKADVITCGSLDYIENSSLKEYYFKNKNKFIEIGFGVDAAKFLPKDDFTSDKDVKILFVGGLDKAHYFKGLEILLKSVAGLENNSWKLNIVGRGDLLLYYKKLTKNFKIEDRVRFWENISNEELPKIYQQSDIFVLPSTNNNEAFGLVLLEAMSSGIPVIASDLPGVRMVFKNNEQGLLFCPGDPRDLKDKINILLGDKELRKKMGAEGRRLILNKYNFPVFEKKLLNIFSNL